MNPDEIQVNPPIVLTLEGLKRALCNNSVLYAVAQFAKNKSGKHRDLLAAEICLHSLRFEIPPFDRIHLEIKGGRKGNPDRETTQLLEQIGHRIDMVQSMIIEAELLYRGNGYAEQIENGSVEFRRLVKWVSVIERRFETFSRNVAPVQISPEDFYQFFVERSYEHVGRKNKISINNFLAVDLLNAVGVNLSMWERVVSDPNKELTQYMIRQIQQVFVFADVNLEKQYQHYDRIRGGLQLILDKFFPDMTHAPTEKVQAYIRVWVQVAFDSYEPLKKVSGRHDLKVALGFIGGNLKEGRNSAMERMKTRIREMQSKAKQTANKGDHEIKEVRGTRKIKKGF